MTVVSSQYDAVPPGEKKENGGENLSNGGFSGKDEQVEDSDSLTIKLKPTMGLLNSCSVIIGSIIGSGIFVSPKGVLGGCGSVGLSLIVWFLCGLFSMVGSYCYAELGTSIKKTGGDYAYIYKAYGPFFAFLRMWTECMVVRPCLCAIVCLTFGTYIIEPLFPNCERPDDAIRLLAGVAILVLTFINAWDVGWAVKVQDICTYAKILALILIIITGAVQIFRGETENFEKPFEGTETDIAKVALSFYSGLFAYNGWNYLNYVIEEVKNPEKTLPKAICISIIVVTTVYVLSNVAYFTTVSKDEMLGGAAVAVMFSRRLYGVMWWIMPIFVSFSTFGGANGILITASRIFFAASREGHMPSALGMVQVERYTPLPAVLFTGAISAVYLCSSDIYALINYAGFSNWLAIGISVMGLLIMRHTHPDIERPIKVNIVWPVLYTLMSVFLVVLPFYASPRDTGMGCLIILSGVPFYFLCVYWENKPKAFLQYVDKVTDVIQKIFMVIPEEATASKKG